MHMENLPRQSISGSYNKFQYFNMVQIIKTMFSDHNKIGLVNDNRKTSRKAPNIWKLNNTFPNSSQIEGEI